MGLVSAEDFLDLIKEAFIFVWLGAKRIRELLEKVALLFGEILGISSTDVAITFVAGVVTLAALIVLYRPLLFASVDEELAAAKGVPVTALSIAFMAILAVAVTQAVQVVGVLLIFALVVTPAAIAVRFTSRPSAAIAAAAGLALLFTWAGLTIAYYSPHPVSFFITTLAFATYIAVRLLQMSTKLGQGQR